MNLNLEVKGRFLHANAEVYFTAIDKCVGTHARMHAHTEKGETHLIHKYNDRSQLASKGEESLGELFCISEPLSQETGKH